MAETSTRHAAPPQDMPPLLGRGGPGPRPIGKVERARDRRGALLRLWGYLRRQRNALILTAGIVAISVGLNVAGPYLLGRAIDSATRIDLASLAQICTLMAVVYASNSLLMWLQNYVMAGASQQTVRAIRDDLFSTLQHLPLRFFDQRPHGDVMSRLTNDIENINLVLADSVTQIVSGLLSMVGIAAIMLFLNPTLALISIVSTAALTLLLNQIVARSTRVGFRQQQAALGALNGLIEETITGQRVVKAYGREAILIDEFDQANTKLRHAATRAQIFSGFVGPLMNMIGNLSLAIVAGIGGWMAIGGVATVGTIASFINYTRQFGRPLSDIANLYNSIHAALAGAERVFEVLDETPEIDADSRLASAPIRGDVLFDDVSFSYEAGTPILKHVSLHAAPGQIVALVGPTGAGKTTIVNLLTRFYEINNGTIRIDGRDLRDFSKAELRQQLGIVLQDTFLFAGSVMENIRYGRLDASDDDVVAAAKLANADQFIHRLPQGYATQLSERAGNLSQGQRQLLAIARALLANPNILILDEATSSVDTRTEQHIQEAMLRLMHGRTSFVIAHRLSTIREADQILVIDAGQVIERGTHQKLLEQNGFYARLYAGQFKAASAATQLPTSTIA